MAMMHRIRHMLTANTDLSYSAYRKPLEDLQWTKEFSDNLQQEVSEMRPPGYTISEPVILLLGSSSPGKSSFVNSLFSISKRRFFIAASNCYWKRTDYRRYVANNYILTELLGFTEKDETHRDNFKLVLEGHVKPNSCFHISRTINEDEDYYIRNPADEDKVHCVIFVFDCSKPVNADVKYFKYITEVISRLGIPFIVLRTKVDEVSFQVKANIRNIFHSKAVHTEITKLAEVLGISDSLIYPIQNYTEEYTIDQMKNIPILIALRAALIFAHDNLDRKQIRDMENSHEHSANETDDVSFLRHEIVKEKDYTEEMKNEDLRMGPKPSDREEMMRKRITLSDKEDSDITNNFFEKDTSADKQLFQEYQTVRTNDPGDKTSFGEEEIKEFLQSVDDEATETAGAKNGHDDATYNKHLMFDISNALADSPVLYSIL